jgi:DNA-binding PadR family transcriptional regulator
MLISLADGPKHGYAMIEDIAHLCGVRLGAGTLYGALTRLEGHGLIVALPSTDRRQPYQLTPWGRDVLAQHLADIQTMTTVGLQRLASA